jgi:hypothetical protein
MFKAFSSRNRNNSVVVHNVRDLMEQIERERVILDQLEQIGRKYFRHPRKITVISMNFRPL